MRSSAKLKISSQDDQSEEENPFSLWTTGPSSPPFNQHKFNDSLASSPRTPSEFEFEFDSICSLEIKDDPPVSPKLIATSYWGAAVSSFDAYAPVMKQTIAPLSHPISSAKQPSGPPSPSVRQLMAEEMHGETDDDFNLDFYSAPQTPMPTLPKKSAVIASEERPLSQDEPSLNSVTCIGRRGKSNSAVLDRRGHDEFAALATQKNQMLQSSKSESNSQFALWSPSFAWEKSEEEDSGVKKQGSKSCVKWAFKDLLRRTVPSSKAEARYITKTMGASSSKKYLSSPNISPNISPMHSHSTSMPTPHSTSMSTLRAARPSTPGQSPTYSPSRSPPRRPSTPGRSPTYSPSRSPPRRPSTPSRMPTQTFNRMPTPSSPRSPLSPHAIHYQQNKAHSLELNRKTFLPYRQSLLGCLGGPGAFSPEQQVR